LCGALETRRAIAVEARTKGQRNTLLIDEKHQ
jgi:hypothetical protein